MSANSIRTPRERLLQLLESNGGVIRLHLLTRDCGFSRSQVDDLLELAQSPIAIRLQHNGHTQPTVVVALKDYTQPKPVTQKVVEARLASMTNQEYLATLDPTYPLRHKRRSGGGARTSTSANEYKFL